MAGETDLFELVTLSTVDYADVTPDGSVPTSWTPINIVEEGTFNPDFKAGARTKQYDAKTRQPFYVYAAADDNKINVTIHKASKLDVVNLTKATLDADGTLQMGSTELVSKAFKFTGLDIQGTLRTLIAYNADVSVSWSGPVDGAQKAVGLQLSLEPLQDNGTPPHVVSYK